MTQIHLTPSQLSQAASSSTTTTKTPNLIFHPSPNPNGHGILIIPGGGYSRVVFDSEGNDTVRFFLSRGWHCWTLEYTTTTNSPSPLGDTPIREGIEAVSQILSRKNEVIRDGGKFGIIGYSAGAHVASMVLTSEKHSSSAIDFGILAYPVISMESDIAHMGSRTNLLGEDPSEELCRRNSPQYHVKENTPPIFLFHTANDPGVKVQNSLVFANAMAEKKRPFNVLVLPDGPHGVHLGVDNPKAAWGNELERWLREHIL